MSKESEMIARERAKESEDMTQEDYELMRQLTHYTHSTCFECGELRLDSLAEAETHREEFGCSVILDHYEGNPVS